MNLMLGQKELDRIHHSLKKNLIDIGAQSSMLIDTAGNIIAVVNNGSDIRDVYSLAALAAANFGAMNSMAKIVGEDEFSLLFHKGRTENIHLSKVNRDFLLINIFTNQLSLGFLRMKVAEVIKDLLGILVAKKPAN
ncbi:MAG: roadblock/LC7 domain-containing protein [Syntrophales bacterium]|nr:roadblock/LC7 domain-containing protein [Syntrophales bacterium]MDD5233454.1 roadblock/LC7 domain-containing protein [Syntrophales bacterium]MDD5532777.1 roadblock/LC7 domain-containing protein [Syntrophales bacterium]HPL64023.1 roadblock/LC7 domain-containing protein [Syntrophales bacterium]